MFGDGWLKDKFRILMLKSFDCCIFAFGTLRNFGKPKLSLILFLCFLLCSFTYDDAQRTFVALQFMQPITQKSLNLAMKLAKCSMISTCLMMGCSTLVPYFSQASRGNEQPWVHHPLGANNPKMLKVGPKLFRPSLLV
jgi:hypothetical protein